MSLDGLRSSMQDIDIGVPQGSVVGPLLFLIYINDLPNATNNLKSILFADDTTMFARNKNVNELCNIIGDDMLLLQDWLIANSLTLNANKSYYIIFSLKKIPNDLRITIGDHVLDRRTQGKFLGIVLDEKLRFSEHVDYLTNKISKLTGLMCKLKTFFPCEILKNIYQSLILPYYNYCILAWGSANISILHPLVSYQKKLVRIVTKSDFLEHTNPLFRQLKILRLEELFSYHAQLFMYKTLVQDRYPSFKRSILDNQTNHNYSTRDNGLRLPYCRTMKCKQNLSYQATKNWNSLPPTIKDSVSLITFKKACKSYHLNKY